LEQRRLDPQTAASRVVGVFLGTLVGIMLALGVDSVLWYVGRALVNPWSAVVWGVGAGLGALVGWKLGQRRKIRTLREGSQEHS